MQTPRSHRSQHSRLRLTHASNAVAIELLESRHLLSNVVWTGTAGDNNWTNANNWTDGATARVPAAADDVMIGSGTGIITNVGGTINSLTSGRSLSLTGQLLTVSNGITLNGATVTLTGTSTYKPAGLIFTGGNSQTLGGTGTLVCNGGSVAGIENRTTNNAVNTSLTIGSEITIHGANAMIVNRYSTDTLINQGTISADVAQGEIKIGDQGPGTLINQGALSAINGGRLTLGGSWSNAATLSETNSTLNLGGAFTTAGLGSFGGTGGTVNVTGTLDNSAATLAIDASTWTLSSTGRIVGGTITESAGARLVPMNGTLDGVTLAGSLTVANTLFIENGLTLSNGATITLDSASTYSTSTLEFMGGSQTLGGNGSVYFAKEFVPGLVQNGAAGTGGATLTIGPGITVHGVQGQLRNADPSDSLLNHGTINADSAGGDINMPYSGNWSNGGTLVASAGTLNLYGNFTTAGLGRVVNAGGIVNLTGNLDNSGATLALTPATGTWNLASGAIKNGTITESGGAQLIPAGGGLDGVTLAGDLTVYNSYLYVTDGLTLADGATITLASPTNFIDGALVFGGNGQTLGGTGNIVCAGDGTAYLSGRGFIENVTYANGAGATLTIGPDVNIRGENAIFTNARADNLLVNRGTIDADVVGGDFEFPTTGSWMNTGSITASAGKLNLNGNYTTAGLGSIRNTGGVVNVNGTLDNTGGILALDASTGTWNLSYQGIIRNGVITESQGGALVPVAGYLSGVTLAGNLDVTDSHSLNVSNGLTLRDGAKIILGATANNSAGFLQFSGTQTLGGTGTVLFAGNFGGDIFNQSSGGQILTIGPNVTMRGTACSFDQSSYDSIVNEGTISADVSGGSINLPQYGSFTNQGAVSALDGGALISGIAPTNYDPATDTLAGGNWVVGPSSTLTLPAGVSIQTNAANLSLTGNGAFPALAGLATNNATLSLTNRPLTVTPVGGTFTNSGTIALDPNSTLAVTGAFTQTAAGTLSIGIDGATAGSGFGQMNASGNATLDGTLDSTIAGGYDPSGGTAFPVVTGAARSGTFAAFAGNQTPSGLPLAVAYDATTAQVVVQPLPTGAAFVRADGLTEGTWTGAYGADGYALFGGASSLPSYATLSVSNASQWTWDPSPSDPRAPQTAPGSASRLAACDFSATSFSIDLNLTDGKSHTVSLYALNWDSWANRDETIQLTDTATGKPLDSRNIGGFGGGTWLTWNVSGHVQIIVINNGGLNAVLSGVFFGPPTTVPAASASFVRADATTGGTWTGNYGADGRSIFGGSTALPSYAQFSTTGQQTYVWQQPSDSDARTLQAAPGSSSRLAACDYSASSFSFDLNLTDGKAHAVSLYALNYDSWSTRAETIQVIEGGSGTVLDSRNVSGFGAGVWLSWNLTGHVRINVTNDGGLNAVVSGIFFDPPHVSTATSASFLKSDPNTQGSWTGAYGADGYDVINAAASVPAYATLNVPSNVSNYTWASQTGDPRALQIASGSLSRIAACDYSNNPSFSFNLTLTDEKAHQLALYFLDYDFRNRAETIQISDASTGAVLDTQSVSDFSQGKYLVWNVSGVVNVTIANAGGLNEVISGIFFG